MKTVLKISVSLLMTLVITNISAQEHFDLKIGEMRNNQAILVIDFDSTMSSLEAIVEANSSLFVRFDKLSIEEGTDESTDYYYMLAEDTNNHIKTVKELVLDNGTFYEIMAPGGGSATLTCSGCSIGCDPKKMGPTWVCYPNCTGSKCNKTITITIDD